MESLVIFKVPNSTNTINYNIFNVKLFSLKAITKNLNLPNLLRLFSFTQFFDISFHFSKISFTNMCLLTSRKKFLNKFFRLCRLSFLNSIKSGFIFGLKKAC